MPALCRSQASLHIAMEPLRSMQGGAVHCHNWDSLINQHPGDIAACAAQAAELQRSDLACLIYTSGTGGAPRGVMQHHGAIQIGRAHVRTPVTNAHLVCRLLLEKKNQQHTSR